MFVACADGPDGLVPMLAISTGSPPINSLPSRITFRGDRYPVKPIDVEAGAYTERNLTEDFGIIGDDAIPLIRMMGDGDDITFNVPQTIRLPKRGAPEAMNRVLSNCRSGI